MFQFKELTDEDDRIYWNLKSMLRLAARQGRSNFAGGHDNSSSGGQGGDIREDRGGNRDFHEQVSNKHRQLEIV